MFLSGLEGSKCFVHGWDGAISRDLVKTVSPLFGNYFFLCVCFESHKLSPPACRLAVRLSEGSPFPLPVFFYFPDLSWYLQPKCSVMQFLPLWILTGEALRGLEFVSILVSVLISDLGGGHYPPHAEREAHQGSKWKCSLHHAAICYFLARVSNWNDGSCCRLDSPIVQRVF